MMTQIPYNKLAPDILNGVMDDFILREGTDYGSEEFTLDQKRERVLKQLKSGKAQIIWDPETETATIVQV
ncbi:MAG: YheU family protein [Bdellovibrionota bacterium]